VGTFVDLVVGIAILGFSLFILIAIPISMINDSKKPKNRKRNTKPADYHSRDINFQNAFDYYHESDHSQFLVYFIANDNLGALKVGVGNFGRLQQILESYERKEIDSPNIGWKVLKIAKFSHSHVDYESGKVNGNEAERRAHYYWRYILHLPLFLKNDQMGFSRIKKNGKILWVTTPGYTETADMMKVCEVSTWNFISKSIGFMGEIDPPAEYRGRELRLLYPHHSDLDSPPNYGKFKLTSINHYSPKATEPKSKLSIEVDNFSGDLRGNNNTRSTRVPREPAHYSGGGIGIYPCVTANCVWPSSSMFGSEKCDKCKKAN